MLAGILHSKDGMCPVIWIFGYPIGSYGLCMVLGIVCIGVTAVLRGAQLGLRWEDVLICGAFSLGAGLCFGNMLYLAVTYTPGELADRLMQGEFQLFQEGFVFYGGMLGGFLGVIIGTVVVRCNGAMILEAALPAVPFGHAIGRIGCLLAGCCHGMPYSGPLAVQDSQTGMTYFPISLLEAVVNSIIGLYLFSLVKQKKWANDLLWAYLSLYSVARFVLEYFRGDEIRGAALGLSTSQWISLGIFLLCVFDLMRKKTG